MNHHTPTSLIRVSSDLLRPEYRTYTDDELHDYAKLLNLLPEEGLNNGVAEAFLRKRLAAMGLHIEDKQLNAMLSELHQLGMVKRRNRGDGNRPYYMWTLAYQVEDLDAYLAGEKAFRDIAH